MKKLLPIVVSVSHGGLDIPFELAGKFLFSEEEVLLDCDTWERELYDFKDDVEEYVDTHISLLVIDMNRAKDDLPPKNPDGVVKTLSVARKQVWFQRSGLTKTEIDWLIKKYYEPYHQNLKKAAENKKVILGIVCHTMLNIGPPKSGTDWKKRPLFCIGNRGLTNGEQMNEPITAPTSFMIALKGLLERHFADFQDKNEEDLRMDNK